MWRCCWAAAASARAGCRRRSGTPSTSCPAWMLCLRGAWHSRPPPASCRRWPATPAAGAWASTAPFRDSSAYGKKSNGTHLSNATPLVWLLAAGCRDLFPNPPPHWKEKVGHYKDWWAALLALAAPHLRQLGWAQVQTLREAELGSPAAWEALAAADLVVLRFDKAAVRRLLRVGKPGQRLVLVDPMDSSVLPGPLFGEDPKGGIGKLVEVCTGPGAGRDGDKEGLVNSGRWERQGACAASQQLGESTGI